MKFLKLAAVSVAALLLITSCTDSGGVNNTAVVNAPAANASPAAPSPSATIDELAMGRKLYTENCKICHKEDGTGGKVTIEGKTLEPDDLTSDKIKKFSDEKIIGYVTNGVPDEGMPAFKEKLTPDQINTVVKYVRQEIQGISPAPAG
jgi:mono/diheme cytochrome c family protein